MRNLASFTIASVIKKLNRIRVHINSQHNNPFPKPLAFWLSEYTYKRRYIKIHPDGCIVGGPCRFVSSLIDFSFIRSIVAHTYRPTGFAYDPASLFVFELFRYLEKYPDMKSFLQVVRDRERGKRYHLYAGITPYHLPCEATFTNLRNRLGEELYNRIFHVLVEIAELLGFSPIRSLPPTAPCSPPMPGTRGARISVASVSSSSSRASPKTSEEESSTGSPIQRSSSREKSSALR